VSSLVYYDPLDRRGGIINWALSICLSVCQSVCRVPRHNSRRKRPRKSANVAGWKPIIRVIGEPLEVKRSKVNVNRPTNAHTVTAQYLPNEKAYELQTWYTDGPRRPASSTSAVTFKVKSQGHKVTWRVWQVLADKSRTKRPRITKIGRNVVHPTGNNAHPFQGQRSKVKVTRPTNAETGSASYLPNEKAYDYELQNCYADGAYQLPRTASYKGLHKVGYCTRAGNIPCRPTRRTQLVLFHFHLHFYSLVQINK